jgi:hypothetical protein
MDLPDFDEPFDPGFDPLDPDLFDKKVWEVPAPIRKIVEQHVAAQLPAEILAKLRDLHARGNPIIQILDDADAAFRIWGAELRTVLSATTMLADKPHRFNGRTRAQRFCVLTILPPVTALAVGLPAQRAIAGSGAPAVPRALWRFSRVRRVYWPRRHAQLWRYGTSIANWGK